MASSTSAVVERGVVPLAFAFRGEAGMGVTGIARPPTREISSRTHQPIIRRARRSIRIRKEDRAGTAGIDLPLMIPIDEVG